MNKINLCYKCKLISNGNEVVLTFVDIYKNNMLIQYSI